MELTEEAIDYRDGDADLSGLLVWDGTDLARPGVVVVHGGAGLDDHAKGRARQFAELGVEVLTSQRLLDGNIATVGYCFGGRAVLELARTGADLAGAISVHGSLQSANPASPGGVRSKVLVCHGALDPHVPTSQVTGFIEEMTTAGADFQLIVYGGAMHGFTHDVGPQSPGVAYHALSDQRSFHAIRGFLDEIFVPN